MTRDGWRAAMLEAMAREEAGDSRFLDLIADLLADDDVDTQQTRECDMATSLLHLGYGVKDRES